MAIPIDGALYIDSKLRDAACGKTCEDTGSSEQDDVTRC